MKHCTFMIVRWDAESLKYDIVHYGVDVKEVKARLEPGDHLMISYDQAKRKQALNDLREKLKDRKKVLR